MGGVAKAVTGAVDSVVSTVGDAVKDVGDAVVNDVVKPVVKAVDNTVQAAIDDPVNTAIRVGALAVGGPAGLAIANGTIALAQGASIEDAALTAGKTYAIGQAGAMAGQAAGAAATEAGYGTYAANTASGATSGLTRAGLSGGDLKTGALLGGVNAAGMTAAKDITDQQLADWSQQQAEKAYENAPSPTEQDVLAADPSIKMDFPLQTTTDATGPGYYDEITGEFVPDQNGPLSSPLDETSGTNTLASDSSEPPATSNAPLGSDLLANAPSEAPAAYDPLLTTGQLGGALNFASNAILKNAMTGSAGPVSPYAFTPNNFGATPKSSVAGSGSLSPNWLSADNMIGDSTGDPYYLAKLHQLYSSLTPDMQRMLQSNNGQATQQQAPMMQAGLPEAEVPSGLYMASGGSTDSAWANLVNSAYKGATTSTNQPQFIGGGTRKQFQLTPLTQLSQQIAQRKASGGGLNAAHPDIPKGHNPEFITGKTGYYASGRGTGQSDDIPAVLHHGDFVVDADTVAALGDGSSKAGAQALEQFRKRIPVQAASGGKVIPAQIADGEYVLPAAFVTALGHGDNAQGAKMLDAMRKQIREHKRSAPTSKIPPKAKSPLDYIKMGMKG